MAIYNALFTLVLFGVFVGTLGGLVTGWILRRAMPARSHISRRWIIIGWAAAWAIGLGIIGTLSVGASGRATTVLAAVFGTSAIGGIGGGVTFWQIVRERGVPVPGAAGRTTQAQLLSLAPENAAWWIPTAIVSGGWCASWIIGLVLALTASDGNSSILAFVLGWGAMGFATGLVWRRATHTRSWWQTIVLTLGWPAMQCFSLSQAFSAGAQGVTLALGVSVTWIVNAVIALPLAQLKLWWPALLAGVGSCVAWIAGNTYPWNLVAFTMFERGYAMRSARQDTALLVNVLLSTTIGGGLLLAWQYFVRRSTDHERKA